MQNLTLELQAFKKDHRPSLQDKRAIAHAEEILTRAHAFLQDGLAQEKSMCRGKNIYWRRARLSRCRGKDI